MPTTLDVEAELERLTQTQERLMQEYRRNEPIIEFLRAKLPPNGKKPGAIPTAPRNSVTPASEGAHIRLPSREISTSFGEPTYGVGIATMLEDLLRTNKRLTHKRAIEAIQRIVPNAPAGTIRSELWNTLKKGTSWQEIKGEFISRLYDPSAISKYFGDSTATAVPSAEEAASAIEED